MLYSRRIMNSRDCSHYLNYCQQVEPEYWDGRKYRAAMRREDRLRQYFTDRFIQSQAIVQSFTDVASNDDFCEFLAGNGPAIFSYAMSMATMKAYYPWCDPIDADRFAITNPKITRIYRNAIDSFLIRGPDGNFAGTYVSPVLYPGWEVTVTCDGFEGLSDWRGEVTLYSLLRLLPFFHCRKQTTARDVDVILWAANWPRMRIWDMLNTD